jgi:hypothetical protein
MVIYTSGRSVGEAPAHTHPHENLKMIFLHIELRIITPQAFHALLKTLSKNFASPSLLPSQGVL